MSYDVGDHNKSGLIAFLGSVAACLIFFTYISFFHEGVDLKELPEAVSVEPAVVGEAAAKDISAIADPWVENPEVVAHGKNVYKNVCAMCHGADGKGDGPAGASLVPKPRNLVEGKWVKGGTSIELFTTVKNGLPGTTMAPFGHLPKGDRWAVVQYIRAITANKKPDDAAKLAAFAATAE